MTMPTHDSRIRRFARASCACCVSVWSMRRLSQLLRFELGVSQRTASAHRLRPKLGDAPTTRPPFAASITQSHRHRAWHLRACGARQWLTCRLSRPARNRPPNFVALPVARQAGKISGTDKRWICAVPGRVLPWAGAFHALACRSVREFPNSRAILPPCFCCGRVDSTPHSGLFQGASSRQRNLVAIQQNSTVAA